MSGYRISSPDTGVRIDPTKLLNFSFNGRTYSGFEGDTLASALLANGVGVLGRSFKYHRPRGLFSAGLEEPNALVTLRQGRRSEPNIKATEIELYDGLIAKSQNCWPSPKFDLMAINQLAGNALSAGFYYKTFMGPNVFFNKTTEVWWQFEKIIRRAAGLGKASLEADPDIYERMHAWCDVLVVGGGPAGLIAGERAAEAGAKVILCEQMAETGGSLVGSKDLIDGMEGDEWAKACIERLKDHENVRILTRTTVQSYYDDNLLHAIERVADHKIKPDAFEPRQRSWKIRAKSVIIATGAFERPLVFSGNDRPGIMLADAARRYAVEYGVLPGKLISIFTNNDTAYHAARTMADCGANIKTIIDVRQQVSGEIRAIAASIGAELLVGDAVSRTSGLQKISAIHVGHFNADSKLVAPSTHRIETDCLLVSGGWSPAIHLTSQFGGTPIWDEGLQAFLPGKALQNWYGAGAMAGKFGLANTLLSATDAAKSALKSIGIKPKKLKPPIVNSEEISVQPAAVYEIRRAIKKGKSFVDLQHDVTSEDVRLAHREGFISVEHLKRYTTLGMATDQGKTSNVTGLAIMAEARGEAIEDVGTTRFRPPFTPVTLGAIAGENYGHLKPYRLSPMNDWHIARGANMYANGLWMRPETYNQSGETVEQAYIREAGAVRKSVGLVDVSTLGKIDVQGPDAGEFLNRIYSNGFAKLPIGKARYGLMLREDGFLFDDGTTWRLDENHYLMTTTTAKAGPVMEHMEYHLDVVWPELKVSLVSVTDQWAGIALAGPNSRKVLEACVSGTDMSDKAFPFMGVRDGEITDIPIKIARLSFSGEMAFEVFCGAMHGQALWDALMDAGKAFDITPYGLEALSTLRIEKGHVAGPELNGRTNANDLGLGGMVSTKKPFIGSVLVHREALNETGRKQLVGLRSLDGQKILGGSHIVASADQAQPGESLGHTTSACFSPELNCYISLGLLKDGRARIGEKLHVTSPVRGTHGAVEVVSPHMVDPDGRRMHG